MAHAFDHELSRRERQIMDIVRSSGEATAAEIADQLPATPSQQAVRTMIRILVDKGYLRHERVGRGYIYKPTLSQHKAQKEALKHVTKTYFGGSALDAIASLFDLSVSELSEQELHAISQKIEQALEEER